MAHWHGLGAVSTRGGNAADGVDVVVLDGVEVGVVSHQRLVLPPTVSPSPPPREVQVRCVPVLARLLVLAWVPRLELVQLLVLVPKVQKACLTAAPPLSPPHKFFENDPRFLLPFHKNLLNQLPAHMN